MKSFICSVLILLFSFSNSTVISMELPKEEKEVIVSKIQEQLINLINEMAELYNSIHTDKVHRETKIKQEQNSELTFNREKTVKLERTSKKLINYLNFLQENIKQEIETRKSRTQKTYSNAINRMNNLAAKLRKR